MNRPQTGHVVAWLGFALGTTVSIAANVTHAKEGQYSPAELIGAAFWPVALMLSVEILTRRDSSRDHWAKRIGLAVGLVLVAGVAAYLSYMHMAGLLISWGEPNLSAHLGPLAVDGLMLVSGLALLPERTPYNPWPDGFYATPPYQHLQPIGPELPPDMARLRDFYRPAATHHPVPIGPVLPPGWKVERQRVSTDHRLVFQWPQPIGPQPDQVSAWDAAMNDLAGTAYAGDVLPRPRNVVAAQEPRIVAAPADNQLAEILAAIPAPDATVQPAKTSQPKPPQNPKQPRAPRAKAPAAGGDKDKAREWFRAEVEKGKTPTGPQLAAMGGVTRRTGTRWLDEFTSELETANA